MYKLVVSNYHYCLHFYFRVHAGKLGEVTNFTIVGGNAKHFVDQYVL